LSDQPLDCSKHHLAGGVLPLSVVIATTTVIMRKKAIDTPRFYEEGSGRYLLIALVMVAFFGLILLGARAHP
jgi:hypothetical protein